MFDKQDYDYWCQSLLANNKYFDGTGQTVLGVSGESIFHSPDHVCFNQLRDIYDTIKFRQKKKKEIERAGSIIYYPPAGRGIKGPYTELHQEWEEFVLSYPAWENIVRTEHKGNSIEHLRYIIDVRGVPGDSIACLMSALRYMWAFPRPLIAFRLLKDMDVAPTIAFIIAAGAGTITNSCITYAGRPNTNHFCVPDYINKSTHNFIGGRGNPGDTYDYSEQGIYRGVSSFVTLHYPDSFDLFPMDCEKLEETLVYIKEVVNA